MQLDVEESTPASDMTLIDFTPALQSAVAIMLSLARPHLIHFHVANWYTLQDMNYFLVLFFFYQVTSGGQADGQTESNA